MNGHASTSAVAALAFALAFALASRALADPGRRELPAAPGETRLEVVAPLCPNVPFDWAAFLSILRAEVRSVPYYVHLTPPGGAAGDDDDASAGAGALLLLETVPCDPATTTVAASYRNLQSGRRVGLSVDLADVVPVARARVLSLVLAELLRDNSSGQPATAAPPAPLAPPAPPAGAAPERPPAPASPARRPSARLAADARVYRSFNASLLGGRVGASGYAAHLPLRAVLDLALLFGLAEAGLGSVDTRAATVAAGLDWTAGAGRAELAVGPRLEAGWGWLSGHSGAASVRTGRIDAPLASLSLAGSIGVRVSSSFRPFLEIEGGLTLAEVVGLSDGARAAGFAGPWVAARVGTALGF